MLHRKGWRGVRAGPRLPEHGHGLQHPGRRRLGYRRRCVRDLVALLHAALELPDARNSPVRQRVLRSVQRADQGHGRASHQPLLVSRRRSDRLDLRKRGQQHHYGQHHRSVRQVPLRGLRWHQPRRGRSGRAEPVHRSGNRRYHQGGRLRVEPHRCEVSRRDHERGRHPHLHRDHL